MRDAPAAVRFEVEREEDGRWLAEVPALSGALAYRRPRDEAVARVEAPALAERLEDGEPTRQLSEQD
jgi:predicted RNase H-like HicB family nuclease